MIVRGNSNINMRQIADAIAQGKTVVFAQQLNPMALVCLEEELERLTNMFISLDWKRGRYVVRSQPFGEIEQGDDNDFEGRWIAIPAGEVEIAVALA